VKNFYSRYWKTGNIQFTNTNGMCESRIFTDTLENQQMQEPKQQQKTATQNLKLLIKDDIRQNLEKNIGKVNGKRESDKNC